MSRGPVLPGRHLGRLSPRQNTYYTHIFKNSKCTEYVLISLTFLGHCTQLRSCLVLALDGDFKSITTGFVRGWAVSAPGAVTAGGGGYECFAFTVRSVPGLMVTYFGK